MVLEKNDSFNPAVCDMDRLYQDKCACLCRGCKYKEDLEEKASFGLFPKEVKCNWDFVKEHREKLNVKEKEVFDEMIKEYFERRTGFIPVELAVRYAHDTLRIVKEMGSKISPLKIKSEQVEPYDLRVSELNNKCAIPVYLKRENIWPVPEELKRMADKGKKRHFINLEQPEFDYDKYVYMPNFFLDDKNEYKRTSSEITINFEIEGVKLKGSFDSAYKIGDGILVFDDKTTAPPSSPHVGYVRQVTAYGMGAEQKLKIESKTGLLSYAKKLGKGFKLAAFRIDKTSEEGIKNRKRTIEFAHELDENIKKFEASKNEILKYRNFLKRGRCLTEKKTGRLAPKCYNFDVCWGGRLTEIVEKI